MLISKEVMLEQATTIYDENKQGHVVVPVDAVLNAPDAQKYGRWGRKVVWRNGIPESRTVCTLCGATNKQYEPPYCPHCGAKMHDKNVNT